MSPFINSNLSSNLAFANRTKEEMDEKMDCNFKDIFQHLKNTILVRCQSSKSNMLLQVYKNLFKKVLNTEIQYLYSMLILGFIIPLTLIIFCYGRIMAKVKRTEKRALGEKIAKNQGRRKSWDFSICRKFILAISGALTDQLSNYGVDQEE